MLRLDLLTFPFSEGRDSQRFVFHTKLTDKCFSFCCVYLIVTVNVGVDVFAEGMKRLRDDVHVNPQFKRPFGPPTRGES